MEEHEIIKVKRAKANYGGNISMQTGFPSPATHYLEPTIDLNKVLSNCADATFYFRIKGSAWTEFNIHENDVLIVDRSITPTSSSLILAIVEKEFQVARYETLLNAEFELWGVINYIIHKPQ